MQNNDIEIYSTKNDGKMLKDLSEPWKAKITNICTFNAKNEYTDQVDCLVNKYNNTYHNTIKMKPVIITSSAYIDFGIENNEKDTWWPCNNIEIQKHFS